MYVYDRKKLRSQTIDNGEMEEQRREESEKRREEERRSEKRRVRGKGMQVREKVEKWRNTVFFQ